MAKIAVCILTFNSSRLLHEGAFSTHGHCGMSGLWWTRKLRTKRCLFAKALE